MSNHIWLRFHLLLMASLKTVQLASKCHSLKWSTAQPGLLGLTLSICFCLVCNTIWKLKSLPTRYGSWCTVLITMPSYWSCLLSFLREVCSTRGREVRAACRKEQLGLASKNQSSQPGNTSMVALQVGSYKTVTLPLPSQLASVYAPISIQGQLCNLLNTLGSLLRLSTQDRSPANTELASIHIPPYFQRSIIRRMSALSCTSLSSAYDSILLISLGSRQRYMVVAVRKCHSQPLLAAQYYLFLMASLVKKGAAFSPWSQYTQRILGKPVPLAITSSRQVMAGTIAIWSCKLR